MLPKHNPKSPGLNHPEAHSHTSCPASTAVAVFLGIVAAVAWKFHGGRKAAFYEVQQRAEQHVARAGANGAAAALGDQVPATATATQFKIALV